MTATHEKSYTEVAASKHTTHLLGRIECGVTVVWCVVLTLNKILGESSTMQGVVVSERCQEVQTKVFMDTG